MWEMVDPAGVPVAKDSKGPQPGTPQGFPSSHFPISFPRMSAKRISCGTTSTGRRGHVKLKRKGVWCIRWEERRNATTRKRIRRKMTIHGTKKDAERALTAELKRIDAGRTARVMRYTLGSWLKEHFDKWCTRVSARTLHDYQWAIRRYVPAHLLRCSLEAVSISDLQELFNEMSKRGLSPTTVSALRAVLRRALNRAMKLGLIDRNVATLVELPKMVRKEMRALSPDEVRALLKTAESDRWHGLWVLLVTTGLRPGEAFGLKWEDWDGNKLSVRRALVRVPGRGWSLAETKTRRSRVIALPEMTIRALQKHRDQQKRERLRLGSPNLDRGLMFARGTGEPLDSHNLVKRHFKPLLAVAGLPLIRLYDLRHTAATLRLANGEHPKVVQEMLGHASIALTMDTYSHVLPGMQEESAARLDALLAGTE